MVKIHWSVYLILGAVTLFASYRIDPQKFKVFIWVGYLFLAAGVAKFGIGFVGNKKESPAERKQVMQEMYKPIASQGRSQVCCPRCTFNLNGYENFCPRCGAYLRNMDQIAQRGNMQQRQNMRR
ncbi:MAG: hypothetical protein KKC75_08005 [Nanoarchaeota archaeon]|nr:hypothetical protein [Nanoarchaeota archaeon]MBU1005273.1 hypothetical protein [Nanoarchaeota archaeon]MBU1947010.1 hypothetical protein [Nanoarchaeota archaeon]